ncbi:hypothetical protein Acsp03_70200 [Actinomadura sp. NBRC 104412]|nr:hypothetical protein [Actinomadura sp. NBRC 104412]GLZ09554.1 hypothetical protein Acsp03_70200 [Actinomadura sp. NBRC 104412]
MRNLVISDQSWTLSEPAEAQVEAPEVQELDEPDELEHSLSFSYARI